MSKRVPELDETVQHLIGTAAQINVHEIPFGKKINFIQAHEW
jgi:hypothetical protein